MLGVSRESELYSTQQTTFQSPGLTIVIRFYHVFPESIFAAVVTEKSIIVDTLDTRKADTSKGLEGNFRYDKVAKYAVEESSRRTLAEFGRLRVGHFEYKIIQCIVWSAQRLLSRSGFTSAQQTLKDVTRFFPTRARESSWQQRVFVMAFNMYRGVNRAESQLRLKFTRDILPRISLSVRAKQKTDLFAKSAPENMHIHVPS